MNSSSVEYSLLCQRWLCSQQGCSSSRVSRDGGQASGARTRPQIGGLQGVTSRFFQLILGVSVQHMVTLIGQKGAWSYRG